MARSRTTFGPGNTAGAKPGNRLGLRHGATVSELVQPRADELLAEIMEMASSRPIDHMVAGRVAFKVAQAEKLEQYFNKTGGMVTSRGNPKKSADFYLRLSRQITDDAKVLGIGAAPGAAVMRDTAGARLGMHEVMAAENRLRAKYPRRDLSNSAPTPD